MELEQIVRGVVASAIDGYMNNAVSGCTPQASAPFFEVTAEASGRHVHLSPEDVERLFGAGHTLTPKRDLSQPGQYLAEERVSLIGPKCTLQNVAVLGPPRGHTQVEISTNDARELGLNPPIALSGDLSHAADMLIASKEAFLMAEKSLIIARNHLHMAPDEAAAAGVKDGDLVDIRMQTDRPLTFNDVVVRAGEAHKMALHIDFDEANACGFKNGCKAFIVGRSCAPCASAVFTPAPKDAAVPCEKKSTAEYRFNGRFFSEVKAREVIASGAEVLSVEPGTVISPLAKDLLNSRQIKIIGL